MEYALKLDATAPERAIIGKIVERGIGLRTTLSLKGDRTDLSLDITACHANGCPLDLQKLLDSMDADFGHDILGIRKHIDRQTGKLNNVGFLPRCSAPELNTSAIVSR